MPARSSHAISIKCHWVNNIWISPGVKCWTWIFSVILFSSSMIMCLGINNPTLLSHQNQRDFGSVRSQVRVCLVIQFGDFRNLYPVHFQRLSIIYFSAGSRFAFSHSVLLLMVFGQRILSLVYRQLLIYTCSYLMIFGILLEISAQHWRAVCIFVLKYLKILSSIIKLSANAFNKKPHVARRIHYQQSNI